jgi:hypothetical protein
VERTDRESSGKDKNYLIQPSKPSTMVKIEHTPIKKIVILEVTSYPTPEKFAEVTAPAKLAGVPIVLNWAEGVLFATIPLPPTTDKLMDEFTSGVIYWQNVSYSLMPKFKPIITISSHAGGIAEIGVMDVSANHNLVKTALWLKEYSSSKS